MNITPVVLFFTFLPKMPLSVLPVAPSIGSHSMDISFLHPDKVDWTPRTLVVQVYDDVDEKTSYDMDLLQYISETPQAYLRSHIANDCKLYLDPSAFDNHTSTDKNGKVGKVHSNIATILNNQSCFNNGYKLMVTRTGAKNNPSKYKKYRLQCVNRHRCGNVSQSTKRMGQATKMPTDSGDRCNFHLNVFFMKYQHYASLCE